jgi:hypothetical protein
MTLHELFVAHMTSAQTLLRSSLINKHSAILHLEIITILFISILILDDYYTGVASHCSSRRNYPNHAQRCHDLDVFPHCSAGDGPVLVHQPHDSDHTCSNHAHLPIGHHHLHPHLDLEYLKYHHVHVQQSRC